MGFDANGKWTSDFYPINDRDNSVPILASKFQTLIQTNLKQSFENCILRDGTGKPVNDINWNGQKITNLATGTAESDAVNKGQMDAAIESAEWANADLSNISDTAKQMFVPVGTVQMAPLNSLPGYLLCNGQAVSRSTYADLFALIGVNFGLGDGITTFNVPDYRGCFLRGLDVDGGSTEDMYTKQYAAEHYHVFGNNNNNSGNFTASNNSITADMAPSTGKRGWNGNGGGGGYEGDLETYSGNLVTSLANQVVGDNHPVNYAINFFIKY